MAIIDVLSVENEVFRGFVTWSLILLIKVLLMSVLTAFHRVKNGVWNLTVNFLKWPKSKINSTILGRWEWGGLYQTGNRNKEGWSCRKSSPSPLKRLGKRHPIRHHWLFLRSNGTQSNSRFSFNQNRRYSSHFTHHCLRNLSS